MPDEQPPDFLDKVPLRDQTLAGVGGVLYLAASPDIYDGLSEAEFQKLKTDGPAVFQVYEQLGKVGLPESFRLPEGFAEHFTKEVLADMEIIRADPAKRAEFRREVREVLMSRSHTKNLYRGSGTTWSDIASQVAGTNRSGKFYSEDRRKPTERKSNVTNKEEETDGRDAPGYQNSIIKLMPHFTNDNVETAVREGAGKVRIREAAKRLGVPDHLIITDLKDAFVRVPSDSNVVDGRITKQSAVGKRRKKGKRGGGPKQHAYGIGVNGRPLTRDGHPTGGNDGWT